MRYITVQSKMSHLAAFLLSILLVMAGCSEPSNGGGSIEVPTITMQPVSVTVAEGGTATLSVTATAASGATLSYQWQKAAKGKTDFTNMPSATSASYTTPALTYADSGVQCRVVVTATNAANKTSNTTSNTAIISVSPTLPAAPTITTPPESTTIAEGGTATLSVTATADAGVTLSYQWQSAPKGSTAFTDIAGATSVSYTISELRSNQSGIQYRVIVTATNTFNRKSSTTSDAATISVTLDPARIVFEMGANDTVIGMREFLLTVSFSGIAQGGKDSLEFIVSESAAALDYETKVKNNPARMMRAFTSNNARREIYFSVTDQVSLNANGLPIVTSNVTQQAGVVENPSLIDLSIGGASEKDIVQANAKGAIVPNTDYYVHVYNRGRFVKSQKVTTANYPTTYPEQVTLANKTEQRFYSNVYLTVFKWQLFLWGQKMWLSRINAGTPIELRAGEIFYLPFRTVHPVADLTTMDQIGPATEWTKNDDTYVDIFTKDVNNNKRDILIFGNYPNLLDIQQPRTSYAVYKNSPNTSNIGYRQLHDVQVFFGYYNAGINATINLFPNIIDNRNSTTFEPSYNISIIAE